MSKTTYIDHVVEMVKEKTNIRNKDLLHLYALLALVKGEEVTAEDVHDGWAMSMNYRPITEHCYGHEHLSIVPFTELTKECQNKDNVYVEAIKEIARELKKEHK